MDSSQQGIQQGAEVQHSQACPPVAQQPNLLYLLSHRLASQNQGLQLQGQQLPRVMGLPAQQTGLTLSQLTTGGMLAACSSMAGLGSIAPQNPAASSNHSLGHSSTPVFTIPPLSGFSGVSLQLTAPAGPSSTASAAKGLQHIAAGVGSVSEPMAAPQGVQAAAAGILAAGSSPHHHSNQYSPAVAAAAAGALAVSQVAIAAQSAHSAPPSADPLPVLSSNSNPMTAQGPAGFSAAAPVAAGAAAAQSQQATASPHNAALLAAAGAAAAGHTAAAEVCSEAAAPAEPATHSNGNAEGPGMNTSSSFRSAAPAGRDLEQCPSDLVAVVCGQLHGWYSSSKDKILLLQQYAGAEQQQLPELQHLQMRQPPTAALPSAWVTRPVFVKLAGPRFSQKHSADAAINLLEPDGSKGVTLMALFRRQRRLADKEQQQQWQQQRQQGAAHHQRHQEQQLQAHGGVQEAVCLQQGGSSSEELTAPTQAAAAAPAPASDPASPADAGEYTPTPSGAADAAGSDAAADGAGDAAGAGAAADGEQQQPVQQSNSPWSNTDSPVQQHNALDLSADIAMVVCGPVKGWYSNSRDKVLLQEPYQGPSEQQCQHQQHSELLQAYPDPAAAPESAWLARKGFMRLAGPQYCKNDSSRAIKMLLPDGSLGTTMATYIKNRQDHLAALRHQAERHTRQQRQQEQQRQQHVDQADLQFEGLASGRRSGRLQAVREYESGRRSSTPSAAGAAGDAGTASGTGSLAEANSACSVPPGAATGEVAAAAAAAHGAGGEAVGHQGVQGSLVPVVCGSSLGWYCSLRDQILPQHHQLERLLDPVQQQGGSPQWVSKTFFMKMAAVQFWKCDSNKAIKLVAPDGTLGSTLGTFIKHERRRMWEQQQQQQQQEPGEGLSMQDPQQQQVLLQANCNPEQLLQLQQQQLQARKADSSAEKRRFGRFGQHGDTHSSMQTPTASGITSTEDDATEDPDYSEGPAAAAGGVRGSNHASSKPSRHRPAEQAAAAAGAWSSEEHSPQHSAQPQHKAVPVMCGTAFGYYSSSRDEVLMLLKKHQQKGWTRVSALPNPKTLPGSYWVTKLAFKKLGGQQHQHDVLKAIKLLQPDGSLGVTLATFLKHERLQREQHEGMSPVLQSRRRQATTSSKHGRDSSNSSGHSTPEQSPAPPPAKKHCRRKAGSGGGAATAAKMAAQAAAHRRALAKIAALVGAAEAAELAAAEYGAGDEGDNGGSYVDSDAAGASGDAATNAAPAPAAAGADVQMGVGCEAAAAAGGDLGGSYGTGPDLSDMSAGTNASDSDLMAAAAPDAAAGGLEAFPGMWLHAAAADAACETPDASEDDHSDDDVVAVACGSVQGWYSRSKDLVMLRQPGDVWEGSETLDDSHEQQQQLLAAQLALAPDSSWLTKQAFKKLGGMQHQHDALKAVKLLQPDGSLGVTLATYLKHSKTQRQRRKQEAREQRRQGQQARLAAFLAAIEAALHAEGWGVQDAVCLDAAAAEPVEAADAAAEAAAAVNAAAAADSMQADPAAAVDAVAEGVQSAAATVDPGAVDAYGVVAAAAASPMVEGSDAALGIKEGAGALTGLQDGAIASVVDAAAAAAAYAGTEADGSDAAAAAMMQLNSDPLAAGGSDVAAAAAAGSIAAADGSADLPAAAGGVFSGSEQLPAGMSAMGDSAGEPPAAAAAADTAAVVAAHAAAAVAAGVASAAAAIAAARAESAAVAMVAAVHAVDRVDSGSADVTPGASDDLACPLGAAGAAAGQQQHIPVGYSAAIAAAAGAGTGGSSGGGGSGGRDGHGADDQNPSGTDASRPAGSSKKRAPAGSAGHSCSDDFKRRKLGSFAAASPTAAAAAAGAGDGGVLDAAGTGVGLGVAAAAAAADVPLVQMASSSTSMLLQEQAAAQAGISSSPASYDLAPL